MIGRLQGGVFSGFWKQPAAGGESCAADICCTPDFLDFDISYIEIDQLENRN